MARRLGAAAAAVVVAGLAVAVWYIGWGVHSCDDWGDNPQCQQMELHADIFLVSLGALAVGAALALSAVAVGRRTSRDRPKRTTPP